MLKTEFKKMWENSLTWIAVLAGAAIALIAFIADVLLTTFPPAYGDSPENMSLIWQSWIGIVSILFFIPVLATFPAACSYYEEQKRHCSGLILIRSGRSKYYFSKLSVIMISAFCISVFPFLLNYLFCLVGIPRPDCPNIDALPFGTQPIYQRDFFSMMSVLFPSLFLNHPVLNSIVHIILTGCWGMNLAALAYGVSLWFRKNIVLTAALPATVIMVIILFLAETHQSQWVIVDELMVLPDLNKGPEDLPIVLFELTLPLLISVVLIICKIRMKKGMDEL